MNIYPSFHLVIQQILSKHLLYVVDDFVKI